MKRRCEEGGTELMATITPVGEGKDVQYRVRAVVGYKPNGDPIQRMRTFKKERDAKAWGREMDTARERGTLVNAGKLTLGDYMTQWLDRCERRLRGNTVANYRDVVRLYILPDTAVGQARARIRLDRLKPADVQQMIDEATTTYTAYAARCVLRAALSEAVRLDLLSVNPVSRTKAPTHRAKAGVAWTASQSRNFLAAAREDRYHALWLLWLHCGARPSELYGVEWRSVDMDIGVLAIERARPYHRRKAFPGKTKNANGERTIDLPPVVVAALRAWRAQQAQERLLLGQAWAGDDLVFTGSRGRPLDPQSLSRGFKRLCRIAGVPPIRLYDLRHTFGTQALESGGDLKTVASVLGHTPQMLLHTYQQVRREDRRLTVLRQAALLAGDPEGSGDAPKGSTGAV
jgi:integrase